MRIIDEYRPATLDDAAHAPVNGRDLHRTLDDLNRAPLLVDNHREGGALDHGGQHRRVYGKVRNAGVLDLEQQRAELLHDAREAGRLRFRRQLELASGSDDDVISPAHQGSPSASTGEQRVARGKFAVDPERHGLKPRVDNPRIAAQLRHQPFV